MDIHKPKPWHSFREFLKEYLIIVVGVLTALAFESGVEWLHWRHLAERHEEEMRAGVKTIAANAIQKLAIDGCMRDGMQGIAEALRKPDAAWRGLNSAANGRIEDYLPGFLHQPSRAWPYTQWESALNDGSLGHFSPEKLRIFGGLYRSSLAISDQQKTIYDLLPELTPLAFDQTLTPQDKARYLAVLARVDRHESLMVSMSRVILTFASDNDMWPPQTVVDPLIEASRDRMGPCVRAPDRTAFRPGGALVQSSVLRKH